jgi:hypothetical protein
VTDRPSDPKLRVVPELPSEERTRPDTPRALAEMLRAELDEFDKTCLRQIEERLKENLASSLADGIRVGFAGIQNWLSTELTRSEGRIAGAVINAISPRIATLEIAQKASELAHHTLRTEFDDHRGAEHTELEMRLARAESLLERIVKLIQPDTIPAPPPEAAE